LSKEKDRELKQDSGSLGSSLGDIWLRATRQILTIINKSQNNLSRLMQENQPAIFERPSAAYEFQMKLLQTNMDMQKNIARIYEESWKDFYNKGQEFVSRSSDTISKTSRSIQE
jgi:hypothetical protein